MAVKDFFRSSQIIASSSLDDMKRDIESAQYIAPYAEDQKRLHPHIDFGRLGVSANDSPYHSASDSSYIHQIRPLGGHLVI